MFVKCCCSGQEYELLKKELRTAGIPYHTKTVKDTLIRFNQNEGDYTHTFWMYEISFSFNELENGKLI